MKIKTVKNKEDVIPMLRSAAQDMTKGNEAGLIIRFALPLLMGNLLQQLYNVADTAIVGKQLGDNALAAVGATGSVTYLFYTLCLGLATGAGIMIAQFFGAGLLQRMRSAVWNTAIVTAVFGILISLCSFRLTEPVLRLMHTDPDLLPMSVSYMRIACGGTAAVAAYNWINAVMRALGDSKTPLIFLGVASVLNVGLDLLFVMVLHTGVEGAAVATVISQCISAGACMIFAFLRTPELRLTKEDCRISREMIVLSLKTGLPIALQSGLIAISMSALQRVTNSFCQKPVMSAYTASMRVEQLIQQPFFSLNAALATFSGQNVGAGETERAERGLKSGLRISSVLGIVFALLFWTAGGRIIRCFISGTEAVAIGYFALRTTSLCYIPLGSIHVIRGFLNGAGDTGYAMMNGMAEVVCRIGGAFVMTSLLGMDYRAIWYTTCVTWFVTGLVGWIRYRRGKWRSKALLPAGETAAVSYAPAD